MLGWGMSKNGTLAGSEYPGLKIAIGVFGLAAAKFDRSLGHGRGSLPYALLQETNNGH